MRNSFRLGCWPIQQSTTFTRLPSVSLASSFFIRTSSKSSLSAVGLNGRGFATSKKKEQEKKDESFEEIDENSPKARMLDRRERLSAEKLTPTTWEQCFAPFPASWEGKKRNRVALKEWSSPESRAIVIDRISELQKLHLPMLNKYKGMTKEEIKESEDLRKQTFHSPSKIIKHLKLIKNGHKFKYDPRCEVIVKVYSCGMSIYDWTHIINPFKMKGRAINTGHYLPLDSIAVKTDNNNNLNQKIKKNLLFGPKLGEEKFQQVSMLSRFFDEEQGVVIGRSFAGVIEHIPDELLKRTDPTFGIYGIKPKSFPFKKGDRVMGISYGYTSNFGTMADYIPVHWMNLNSAPENAPLEICGAYPLTYETGLESMKIAQLLSKNKMGGKRILFLGSGNAQVFTSLFPIFVHCGIRSLTIVLSDERHRPYFMEILDRYGFGADENDLFPVKIVGCEGYMDSFKRDLSYDDLQREIKDAYLTDDMMGGDHNLNPNEDEQMIEGKMMNEYAQSKKPKRNRKAFLEGFRDQLLMWNDYDQNPDFHTHDFVFDALSFTRDDFMCNMQLTETVLGVYFVCHTREQDIEVLSDGLGYQMKHSMKWHSPIARLLKKNLQLNTMGICKLPPHPYRCLARGSMFSRRLEEPLIDVAELQLRPDLVGFPLAIDRVYSVDEAVPHAFEYFHNSDPYDLGENTLIQFRKEEDFNPDLVAECCKGIHPVFPFYLPYSDESMDQEN